MAGIATQLPKTKRRARWPYLLVVVALLAVISVKWLVPIAMEQRAIAVIRAECPLVSITNPGGTSPLLLPPPPPKSTKDSLELLTSFHQTTTLGTGTFANTEYIGPAIFQEWTDHELLRIELIAGDAENLRPAADKLHWLQHVRNVCFYDASDEDMNYIRQFTNLESLTLLNPSITDAGLSRFGTLSNLRRLKIRQAEFQGSGLASLSKLKQLEELEITLTPLTDQGLKYIGQSSGLKSLLLIGTSVTGEGLKHLQDMKNLETLSLVGTDITDAGLKHLLPLANLEDLNLSETAVTFDGVRQLYVLHNLRRLRLGGLELSEAQRDELQRTLPGCEVTRY
ncbi:Leucine Rich repeats (2 copies) [Symmachiella dynata]|uniref:Leucine Rich repeats (2 copies) n=1 Tax=Symmachiella dynata TaxID=2527995 RepID=A0A517ZXH3_9PLAN|nr:hypothetical protein [Symmachiella dynata]QDU47177.1 Leucine Rich repeats (2 copies) [Symmachiella dynata]